VLAVLAGTAPAVAAPVEFSAVVNGELGYGSNPQLRPGVTASSGFVSGTFTPKLFYQTPRSTTTLQGAYDRDQYFSKFGYTDSLNLELLRTDQLSEQLASSLSASYKTSNKSTLGDPDLALSDPLNIGRRMRGWTGNYQLQWQRTAHDRFTYSARVDHSSTDRGQGSLQGLVASAYTQYGVSLGYDRVLDARNSIGVQTTLTTVHSKIYPDSRTVQPSLSAKHQLNAVWEIDGNIGIVLQRIYGLFPSSGTSLSYGVNTCGTYPRTNICLSALHTVAPSSYGSLRTTSAITGSIKEQLTEHSHVELRGNYTRSKAEQGQLLLPGRFDTNSRTFLASAQYDRDLTERLTAGFGGTYQTRTIQPLGKAHAISGSIHISAKLGRK
jgi:hypothetical protein